MRFWKYFAALLVTLLSNAADSPRPRMVTLTSALQLANSNNLELISNLTGVDQANAKVELAKAGNYPKVIGTAVLSPLYQIKGDALHSETDLTKWGVWLQSTVTILQPFYTWGKLSSLREAAMNGVEVARAQARKDKDQLAYEVKELFYGSILAEQLYNFLDDGKREIDDLLKKTEEDQRKRRPSISKRDYYRLKIFSAEADYRFQEAQKLRFLARHALSLKLGFDPNEETIPEDTTLVPIEAPIPSEEQLLAQMREHKPEFAQLTHGIAAKKALLAAEKTNKYPMFFLGGLLTFAYSNNTDRQQSAFAYDPYNHNTGGVGLGVQWTWDFATTLANESGLRAEIDELEKRESYARSGFRLELKKVLKELEEARAKLAASRDAYQVGRRWLVSETMGYSVGLGDVKSLIDAYLARAKTAKDHWEATYLVNMNWAALSRTVGTEVTPSLVK